MKTREPTKLFVVYDYKNWHNYLKGIDLKKYNIGKKIYKRSKKN